MDFPVMLPAAPMLAQSIRFPTADHGGLQDAEYAAASATDS
jgi:hypothetical protein